MKITDLLDKHKPEIIEELENVSQFEASKVVGGATAYPPVWLQDLLPYITRYTPSSPSKGMGKLDTSSSKSSKF